MKEMKLIQRKRLELTVEKGNLCLHWFCGTFQYVLNSRWDYSKPQGYLHPYTNIRQELKNYNTDPTRKNLKFNIFRNDNANYFYSDGNTDAWVIMAHFILEKLSEKTNIDYRKMYLNKRIYMPDTGKDLLPINILVDNRLLSDIICEIFEQAKPCTFEEYDFLLDFCVESKELENLFEESKLTQTYNLFNSLDNTEKKEFLTKIIGEMYEY